MKEKTIIAVILIICLTLAACAGSPAVQTEADAPEIIAKPEGKAESHTLTGTWESDDGETVVPIILHLYEDGTAFLESHRNRAGEWNELEDGKLSIKLGDEEYVSAYSEIKELYFLRINETMGDEIITIYMEETPDAAKIAEKNNQALIDRISADGFTAEGEPGEIIFYGGSNFQKWKTLEDDLAGYPVRNNSIGGSNDPVRRHFAKERVYDLKPSLVFYMSSSNDWTSGQDKEDIKAYKQELFDEFAQELPDTIFVILSSTPNPLRYFGEYHEGMTEVDDWTEAYCSEKENFEFLDVVPALSINGGAEPNGEIWQADRLHLNSDGYAILTALVREEIEKDVEKYGLTFATAEEIPEDGEEERAAWEKDWTDENDWLDESFDGKSVSYQLSGSWSMEGDYPMTFHLLANLYSDGSVRVYQHSPTRGDNFYFGYWTERDTQLGHRISLTMRAETNGNELVEHDYSYRFFANPDGQYSFGLDFGIIPGSYMRAAELSGGSEIVYSSEAEFAEIMDAEA
ncbi:MAG: hypothetical protein II881_06000 [Oscillospiraceae bacterium]|nr:hypothetical protein [Oscillospiraceae bacterium]